jgi:hypothetical protein
MKPVPKAIIIVVLIGGIGYGASLYMDYRKANAPAEVAAPVQAPIQYAAPAQPTPAESSVHRRDESVAPATTQAPLDRGLGKLLGK